jgi:hypothetical protein
VRRLVAAALIATAGCNSPDAARRAPADPRLLAPPTVAAAPPTPQATAPVVPPSDDPPNCLHYEPAKSELRGTVTMARHYGPPNYGEDTLHDQRVNVPILHLDSAIAVCGSPADPANTDSERDVRQVQLVTLDPRRRPLPHSGHVVAKGELFHWIAGLHFTRVLLNVDSIRTTARPR